MKAVVSDTHSAIWYLVNSNKLSFVAERAMDDAVDANELIYVSAISLVEMTYLIEKRRLEESDLQALLKELNDPASSFELVPIDLGVTETLRTVSRVQVPDMPDRIIAATAVHLGLPLVTRDGKIRAANLQTIW